MEQLISFVTHHWALWLAFFVILGLLFALELQGKLRGISPLPALEVTNLINHQSAQVVDVREASAFLKGHILGATNVPVDDLAKHLDKLKEYKDKPIVLVDAVGQQQALNVGLELQKQGFEKIYTLKGGMTAWQNEHFPLVKPKK